MVTNVKASGFEAYIESPLIEDGGYERGQPTDFDREHAVDLDKLFAFLRATQFELLEKMGIDAPGSSQRSFLFRLRNEITSRGVLDVLLKGIKHQVFAVDLFYTTPSAENPTAVGNFEANVFSVIKCG